MVRGETLPVGVRRIVWAFVFAPAETLVLVNGQCVVSFVVHVVKFGMVVLPQLSKQ
jgi:hypothetical protein